MNRPQESHCDLGLIENDNTPLLTKKAPVAGTTEAHVQTINIQEKIVNTTEDTALKDLPLPELVDRLKRLAPTGTPASVDADAVARVMSVCTTRGVDFSMENTLRGTVYKVYTPDDERIAWTYDLTEALNAACDWPRNLGQLEGWDVGARRTLTDDEGSSIDVVAIIDREPGDTVRELWVMRPNWEPFDIRFGSPEDWRKFAAAVAEVTAILDADVLADTE